MKIDCLYNRICNDFYFRETTVHKIRHNVMNKVTEDVWVQSLINTDAPAGLLITDIINTKIIKYNLTDISSKLA